MNGLRSYFPQKRGHIAYEKLQLQWMENDNTTPLMSGKPKKYELNK